jgi:hypothetical protein
MAAVETPEYHEEREGQMCPSRSSWLRCFRPHAMERYSMLTTCMWPPDMLSSGPLRINCSSEIPPI